MSRGLWGTWTMLRPLEAGGAARADFLANVILDPLLREESGLQRTPDIPVPLSGPPKAQEALARRLAETDFLFADVTGAPPEILYHLGARDLLLDRTTVPFLFADTTPVALEDMFLDRLILVRDDDAPAARRALESLLKVRMATRDDAVRPLLRTRLGGARIALPARPAPRLRPPPLWRVSNPSGQGRGVGGAMLGIWCGDVASLTLGDGVHALVNSENTYLEMARVHDRGLSAAIRHMGAHWTNNRQDSDDFIYRQLLARAGLRRPVPPGAVILTPPGRLAELGVRVVAHVAAVEPPANEKGEPMLGAGYQPVEDLELCVRNVLGALERRLAALEIPPLPRQATVLMPLLGTGNARGDPRIASQRIVRCVVAHVLNTPRSRLGKILFLAYSEQDYDLCCDALSEAEGVESVVPSS